VTEKIFALDIGTRTVVGLILEITQHRPRVLAAEIREHRERSMLDGQIHDVPQVAGLVMEVKETLEKATDSKLPKVAVAAAGRALKTTKAAVIKAINSIQEINDNQVLALEIEAVQAAQTKLTESKERLADYHCVGYSVVRYQLDGQPIAKLTGQYGNEIGVEIIATFLPRVVVDSLVNVVQKAGLELSSLTLEPIAALNIIIPASMRQINIALVDIGAGTSDIAVTNKGTVTGYAMVPAAGDEITEALCEHYLLDFHTGERVKRSLSVGCEVVEFQDIVGVDHQVSAREVTAAIKPAIDDLAQKIAAGVLEVNEKTPQAVIAIGGGSQTPLLTEMLAEKLSLPGSRVAVRGREALAVEGQEEVLIGPQAVTPIGIAASWEYNRALEFSDIKVNGRPVRLISENGKGTVADALLAAGINARQLYGRPGMGLSITVNGETHIIKGCLGAPASIAVNGNDATLDTEVANGYLLEISPGERGQDARATVKELINSKFPTRQVIVNGEIHLIEPKVIINGTEADGAALVTDKAEMKVIYPRTAKEILNFMKIPLKNYQVFINGEHSDENIIAASDDKVEVVLGSNESNSFGNILVNEEPVELKKDGVILTDLFNYIDFDPMPPTTGSKLLMQVNGSAAGFTTMVHGGDQVTIKWQ